MLSEVQMCFRRNINCIDALFTLTQLSDRNIEYNSPALNHTIIIYWNINISVWSGVLLFQNVAETCSLLFSRAQLARMRLEREESDRLRKDLEEKVKIMEEEQKKRMKGDIFFIVIFWRSLALVCIISWQSESGIALMHQQWKYRRADLAWLSSWMCGISTWILDNSEG